MGSTSRAVVRALARTTTAATVAPGTCRGGAKQGTTLSPSLSPPSPVSSGYGGHINNGGSRSMARGRSNGGHTRSGLTLPDLVIGAPRRVRPGGSSGGISQPDSSGGSRMTTSWLGLTLGLYGLALVSTTFFNLIYRGKQINCIH